MNLAVGLDVLDGYVRPVNIGILWECGHRSIAYAP